MFTGLVEEIGTVRSITPGTVYRIVVGCRNVRQDAATGDSVAVNGVCLTVTSVGASDLSFDAVPETIRRSALAQLGPGDGVNLEGSLRAGRPIGGHFVMGHVDGVGMIESIKALAESREIRFSAPSDVTRYIVEKGSVAVDGISLTVASVDPAGFTVAAIPHTLDSTTLGSKRSGHRVNLETDIIGKYVERFLGGREKTSPLTEDLLRDSGFM